MKYFGFFLAAFLVAFLVWFGAIWGEMGNPSRMSQWVWDVYQKKIDESKTDDRRVVVVAGSNALFGVDSEMLSRAFGVPVLNFGVNAGVELPVTLYMSKRVIKKGDLVLMPLEYPMYNYNGECGEQMIDFVLSRVPRLFWKLSSKEMFYIVWHVSFKRVWDGYFDISKKPMMVGVYGAKNVDKNGDQIGTELKYRSKEMFDSVLKTKAEKYGAGFSKDALSWRYISKFVAWCKNRGARVIFMPSVIAKEKSYFDDKKERWFYTHIADVVRSKGWKFVGEPYKYMYDKKFFFNTNFHLIQSAREFRTKQMIKDLSSALSPTNISNLQF